MKRSVHFYFSLFDCVGTN